MNDKLIDLSLVEYLDKLSSHTSAPGGGSTAALAGALAASLIIMIAGILDKKKKLPKKIKNDEYKRLKEIKKKLLDLCDKDAKVYAKFRRMKDKNSKEHALLLRESVDIPFEICEFCRMINDITYKIISYVKTSLINDIDAAIRLNEIAFVISKNNIISNIEGTNMEMREYVKNKFKEYNVLNEITKLKNIVKEVRENRSKED